MRALKVLANGVKIKQGASNWGIWIYTKDEKHLNFITAAQLKDFAMHKGDINND